MFPGCVCTLDLFCYSIVISISHFIWHVRVVHIPTFRLVRLNSSLVLIRLVQHVADIIKHANQIRLGLHVWYQLLLQFVGLIMAQADSTNPSMLGAMTLGFLDHDTTSKTANRLKL